MNPMISWVRNKCAEVIESCRQTAVDGSCLFTPDGVGHYGALWTRDFAYLVEHGASFLRQQEVRRGIEILLDGQRADGAVPDRVNTRLVPVYQPGQVAGTGSTYELASWLAEKQSAAGFSGPLGKGPALDNPLFLVALVYHYSQAFEDHQLVRTALPALRRGLDTLPLNRGLVFNDAQRPSCTYGFQDTVAKGGHDLFCSLLFIVACRQMAKLDPAAARDWEARAAEAEANLWLLWDHDRGVYLAASEICRQVDVWGNAFAVAASIGPADKRQAAAHYLSDHYSQFVYAGQVRHLPEPENWERLFIPVPAGTYQNGGYWGTASGWLIEALLTVNPPQARQMFRDLLAAYQRDGILEWVSPAGGQGPDLYVATLVHAWSLLAQAEEKGLLG